MRLVAIANPASRRWQLFERELAACSEELRKPCDVQVVPWRDVIPRDGNLDGLEAFDRPALVRLESPGRDFDVTRRLLQAGERPDGNTTPLDWSTLPERRGELVRPGLVYRGFQRVLAGLHASFAARPHLRPTACPLGIAAMFDKNATSERLTAAGIPCPLWFAPRPDCDPDQLYAACAERRVLRAYVKLATGSSAAGIAIIDVQDASFSAITSIVAAGHAFFSSRRLQRSTGKELDVILRFLTAEGATVQQEIPKAEIDGQNFDVRVIVIDGRPEFTIFRLSSGPLTNLHFGGRRGETCACRGAIPRRIWLDALDHCIAAAGLFDSLVVGVDVAFERGSLRHQILEVNAFGDYFPDWSEQGRTVHRVVIERLQELWNCTAAAASREPMPSKYSSAAQFQRSCFGSSRDRTA